MPKASLFAEDLHPTVFDKAAAYLFHLECNHPFLDGNKRTGTITALTFLGQNGIHIKFSSLCKARRPKYEYYHEELKKKYGAKNLGDAHWALMTRDVIPGSRKKSFAEQQQLIANVGKGYAVPMLLDAAVSILMAYFMKNERLYGDEPGTLTRCQEKVNYQSVVGGFSADGLYGNHSSSATVRMWALLPPEVLLGHCVLDHWLLATAIGLLALGHWKGEKEKRKGKEGRKMGSGGAPSGPHKILKFLLRLT